MKIPRRVNDFAHSRPRPNQPKPAHHADDLHIGGNVDEAAVLKIDPEVTGQDVCSHRGDLGPGAMELEESAHESSTGRAVRPDSGSVTGVGLGNTCCGLMEHSRHLLGEPVRRSWVPQHLNPFQLVQPHQVLNGQAATPLKNQGRKCPRALSRHLAVDKTGKHERLRRVLQVIEQGIARLDPSEANLPPGSGKLSFSSVQKGGANPDELFLPKFHALSPPSSAATGDHRASSRPDRPHPDLWHNLSARSRGWIGVGSFTLRAGLMTPGESRSPRCPLHLRAVGFQ